jgi:hypothetical protein
MDDANSYPPKPSLLPTNINTEVTAGVTRQVVLERSTATDGASVHPAVWLHTRATSGSASCKARVRILTGRRRILRARVGQGQLHTYAGARIWPRHRRIARRAGVCLQAGRAAQGQGRAQEGPRRPQGRARRVALRGLLMCPTHGLLRSAASRMHRAGGAHPLLRVIEIPPLHKNWGAAARRRVQTRELNCRAPRRRGTRKVCPAAQVLRRRRQAGAQRVVYARIRPAREGAVAGLTSIPRLALSLTSLNNGAALTLIRS